VKCCGDVAAPFLALAVDGDEWQLYLLPHYNLWYPYIESYMGSRASLDGTEKRKISCPCWELSCSSLVIHVLMLIFLQVA
jgi:hypothetical protein